MDEDNPTQMEPIYLTSEKDTESPNPMSDQELTGDGDAKLFKQFVIQSNDLTNVAQATNPIYDVNIPPLSPSATTELQLSKHKHNV